MQSIHLSFIHFLCKCLLEFLVFHLIFVLSLFHPATQPQQNLNIFEWIGNITTEYAGSCSQRWHNELLWVPMWAEDIVMKIERPHRKKKHDHTETYNYIHPAAQTKQMNVDVLILNIRSSCCRQCIASMKIKKKWIESFLYEWFIPFLPLFALNSFY